MCENDSELPISESVGRINVDLATISLMLLTASLTMFACGIVLTIAIWIKAYFRAKSQRILMLEDPMSRIPSRMGTNTARMDENDVVNLTANVTNATDGTKYQEAPSIRTLASILQILLEPRKISCPKRS